jgi:two-component system OmpR family response regulator
MRILVIDDDPKFRTYISAGLRESGVECETAEDGQAALDLLEKSERSFDLILLDVMMPKRDGWEVLFLLREKGRETPVIFVTARDSVEERVKGLQLGADDYIIKPFAIEAVVRRRKSLLPLEYGDLKLDLATRAVWRGGRALDLSPREFDLLRVLVSNADRVMTRAELLASVWGIHFDPETNVVDVHVARLRRKLEAHARPLIHTVRGEGYVLAAKEHV